MKHMSPCFGDTRKPWEVFGRRGKRGVTWRSWAEVKVYNRRGERGAAGRRGATGKLLWAGKVQL